MFASTTRFGLTQALGLASDDSLALRPWQFLGIVQRRFARASLVSSVIARCPLSVRLRLGAPDLHQAPPVRSLVLLRGSKRYRPQAHAPTSPVTHACGRV